jgi:diguanylate cyclase (GGDEF)-like protein
MHCFSLAAMVISALLALVGLAAAATALAASRRNRILAADLQAALAQAAGADKALSDTRRQLEQAETEVQFLARFVRELPLLAQELNAAGAGRQIPSLLLGAAARMLEPRRALVAVRRRATESDPDLGHRLAVAASWPTGWLSPGTEIRIGTGEIGFAAEVQRVMDRRDFEAQPARKRLREESGECRPDLVAPMVFGEETVGVIALEGLKRTGAEARDALRLLAQIGAVSVHTQARYSEMKATASIDGLTCVFNKRYLTHRLAEELHEALRTGTSLAVFIFDVDNFKHYNDRNGHVAGDRLLQKLARLVSENTRRDTLFGRFGGEEFLMIFPGATRAQALAAADNVRRAIASHEFAYAFDQPLGCVSVSGGVAECPLDGTESASLLRAADEALYAAKRSGRNRVLAFEPRYLGGEEALEPVQAASEGQERGSADVVFGPDDTQAFFAGGIDATPAAGTLLAAGRGVRSRSTLPSGRVVEGGAREELIVVERDEEP